MGMETSSWVFFNFHISPAWRMLTLA
jgi:hypothetical protein